MFLFSILWSLACKKLEAARRWSISWYLKDVLRKILSCKTSEEFSHKAKADRFSLDTEHDEGNKSTTLCNMLLVALSCMSIVSCMYDLLWALSLLLYHLYKKSCVDGWFALEHQWSISYLFLNPKNNDMIKLIWDGKPSRQNWILCVRSTCVQIILIC